MKKEFVILVIMVAIAFSCQKEEVLNPLDESVTVSLQLKSGLYDNIVEKGMANLFQGTAQNYSSSYPFLWIIEGDSTSSYELTKQHAFAEEGQKEVSLTVYDENGNPATAVIDIVVINEYPYPTEFKHTSNLMTNGKWLYTISVNLNYVDDLPEKYYWFEKNQEGEWIINEITNVSIDQNGVKWGKFLIATYNTTKIWGYGTMINGVIKNASLTGSKHYNSEEAALHSAFYNGGIAYLPFIFPEIPGTGDNIYKVTKWGDQITIYFNFIGYSNYQINPVIEIRTGGGTERRQMAHFNGTGWANIILSESDLVDNLATFRFGNIVQQVFHLSQNEQANGWNESQGFIILKIIDI
jgi:PKD repeat protein